MNKWPGVNGYFIEDQIIRSSEASPFHEVNDRVVKGSVTILTLCFN